MTQTITDLWNGNIAPVEHCGAHDPELNYLSSLMERNREALGGGLTAAQMETFQKYIDCSDKYLLRMLEIAFCDGFTVAAKLLTEALLG